MSFVIQVSNPPIKSFVGTQVAELEEAIEKIFPEDTEDAYFIWNGIPITLGYKYDLPENIYDVLVLLEALLNSEQGSYTVDWVSTSFDAVWDVEWADNRLTIASQWSSTAGSYEDLLNSRSQLVVEKDRFVYEWKALLRKLIEAIEISGIEIKFNERLDYLYQIEAAIPKLGSLYQYIHQNQPVVPIADKLLLTITEVQALTGLSGEFLLFAINKGELKAKLIGRGKGWRVKRTDIEAYIDKL